MIYVRGAANCLRPFALMGAIQTQLEASRLTPDHQTDRSSRVLVCKGARLPSAAAKPLVWLFVCLSDRLSDCLSAGRLISAAALGGLCQRERSERHSFEPLLRLSLSSRSHAASRRASLPRLIQRYARAEAQTLGASAAAAAIHRTITLTAAGSRATVQSQ